MNNHGETQRIVNEHVILIVVGTECVGHMTSLFPTWLAGLPAGDQARIRLISIDTDIRYREEAERLGTFIRPYIPFDLPGVIKSPNDPLHPHICDALRGDRVPLASADGTSGDPNDGWCAFFPMAGEFKATLKQIVGHDFGLKDDGRDLNAGLNLRILVAAFIGRGTGRGCLPAVLLVARSTLNQLRIRSRIETFCILPRQVTTDDSLLTKKSGNAAGGLIEMASLYATQEYKGLMGEVHIHSQGPPADRFFLYEGESSMGFWLDNGQLTRHVLRQMLTRACSGAGVSAVEVRDAATLVDSLSGQDQHGLSTMWSSSGLAELIFPREEVLEAFAERAAPVLLRVGLTPPASRNDVAMEPLRQVLLDGRPAADWMRVTADRLRAGLRPTIQDVMDFPATPDMRFLQEEEQRLKEEFARHQDDLQERVDGLPDTWQQELAATALAQALSDGVERVNQALANVAREMEEQARASDRTRSAAGSSDPFETARQRVLKAGRKRWNRDKAVTEALSEYLGLIAQYYHGRLRTEAANHARQLLETRLNAVRQARDNLRALGQGLERVVAEGGPLEQEALKRKIWRGELAEPHPCRRCILDDAAIQATYEDLLPLGGSSAEDRRLLQEFGGWLKETGRASQILAGGAPALTRAAQTFCQTQWFTPRLARLNAWGVFTRYVGESGRRKEIFAFLFARSRASLTVTDLHNRISRVPIHSLVMPIGFQQDDTFIKFLGECGGGGFKLGNDGPSDVITASCSENGISLAEITGFRSGGHWLVALKENGERAWVSDRLRNIVTRQGVLTTLWGNRNSPAGVPKPDQVEVDVVGTPMLADDGRGSRGK